MILDEIGLKINNNHFCLGLTVKKNKFFSFFSNILDNNFNMNYLV